MNTIIKVGLCLAWQVILIGTALAQQVDGQQLHQAEPPAIENNSLVACTQNIVDNGDFENFSFVSSTACGDPGQNCSFNNNFGCTSNTAPFQSCAFSWGDWWPSHGTPEIWHNGAGGYSAVLWSCRWNAEDNDYQTYGEGIFLNCYDFEKDKLYNITFQVLVNDGPMEKLYIDLAHSGDVGANYTISYTVDNNYEIPSVANTQNIYTGNNLNNSGWATVSVNFIPNDDYNVLWIHPFSTANRNVNFVPKVYLDNVCIQCEQFPNTVTYATPATIPGWTYAHTLILATNQAQVLSGQNITFQSGEEILLEPDFTVELGANFLAYIDPLGICTQPVCATGNTLDDPPDQRSLPAIPDGEIEIFPNPNAGLFEVRLNQTGQIRPYTIILYDYNGREIIRRKANENSLTMDLQHLSKGVYLLQIQQESTLTNHRLILQ